MKVFTAQQMRDFDRDATQKYFLPSAVLMENAALRAVELLELKFSPLAGKKAVVLCGKGNNGGDGFAIARHLLGAGCHLKVIVACSPESLEGDALANFKTLQSAAASSLVIEDEALASTLLEDPSLDFAIDALLGTGFSGSTIKPPYDAYLKSLNASHAPRIAIDIPSGTDADSGAAADGAARADYAITFAAPKRGMFLREGAENCGEIWVGEIGSPLHQMQQTQTGCRLFTFEEARSLVPCRRKSAHKGDAGRVVFIGGSTGMSGAPVLSSRAVLRAGAGLCIAALPEKIIPTFASAFSEATSHPLPCSERGTLLEKAIDEAATVWENAHTVAIGPGLGRDESTFGFVRRAVRECPHPLVIDADALYALRAVERELKEREPLTVLTPHPGEMAELMQMSVQEVQHSRLETAVACAQKFNAIVLLKGAYSITAHPGGETIINTTGNPGMATGGSGDVLTGIIAAALAQQAEPEFETVAFSVYLHGLAGDLAFREKGNGLLAGDIIESIPDALLQMDSPLPIEGNSRLKKLG